MIPLDISPELMGIPKDEAKLRRYQQKFEQIKYTEDLTTRKIELEQLLGEYSSDRDIIQLARNCSWGIKGSVQIEKIKEITDLKYDILREIIKLEIKEKEFKNEIEKTIYYVKRLNTAMNEDPLTGIAYDAYQRKYGTLDSNDLRKQFTI